MASIDLRLGTVAIAAAGTGFAAALPLGGLLVDPAGVAAGIVPLALLAAGAVVLLRPPKARPAEGSARLRPRPGVYPAEAEAPALKPEAWLGRFSALELGEADRERAIDRALLAQFGARLDDPPIRLLLAGIGRLGRENPDAEAAAAFLESLSAAMRLDAGAREPALRALEARMPPLPEPGPHASVETRMLAAFAGARERSGLASASFAWLRFHRRDLWFALSSLGRPAPFVEGLMPLMHYEREIAAGTALPTIETAGARGILMGLAAEIEVRVRTINDALIEIIEEDRDDRP